jgi:membrane associated rhomboid family serine protease
MQHRTRSRSSGISFYVPGFPPGVKWLLIANVAVFILWFFTGLELRELWGRLALVPTLVVNHFMFWQLATYMFLHGGFGHILWNMLALWMFGADLEQSWGTKRFLQFYFFSGIGAGICVVIANYIAGTPDTATIGASGAIFGILLAYAMMYPNRTILFGFLIPIQVKWFVLIIGVISFLSAFGSVNSRVSEFAHLGGLLFAYIFLKLPRRRQRLDLAGSLNQRYRRWKVQRAKRKFQVYLKKHGSDRDPRVH